MDKLNIDLVVSYMIWDILEKNSIPLSTHKITELIKKWYGENTSWTTVHKCLDVFRNEKIVKCIVTGDKAIHKRWIIKNKCVNR